MLFRVGAKIVLLHIAEPRTVAEWVGRDAVLCGHNVGFDVRFLVSSRPGRVLMHYSFHPVDALGASTLCLFL